MLGAPHTADGSTSRLFGVATMSTSDDKKLAALVRKNAAKAAKSKGKARRRHDDTLPLDTDEDTERQSFFSGMKKREF